jgi:hypothetical protein
MKDQLPRKVKNIECGIINLQNSTESGSHWVAYYKNHDKKYYFDSYGDAKKKKKPVTYLGSGNLVYNSNRFRNYNGPPICGQLCLIVLEKPSKNDNYEYIYKKLG